MIRPTEIKVVTKEVYDDNSRNWTHRAGTFLEQSRALIDTYLGRWDRGNLNSVENDDEEEVMQDIGEECTSGEEVWGTPTSGENDEMQMFNSDQTHSVNSRYNFPQRFSTHMITQILHSYVYGKSLVLRHMDSPFPRSNTFDEYSQSHHHHSLATMTPN